MPIFGYKSLNSVNTTLFYGLKKSIGYPFFLFFTEKSLLSCPWFVKNVHSLKNTLLSCPYFFKKTSILSKTFCSHIIFFSQIFYEKSHSAVPIFGPKNVISVKHHYIIGQKNSIVFPIFRFAWKNLCSHAHILLKTFILSKTQCSHVIFSNVSCKTPYCLAHIWSEKRQICQNYNLYWGQNVFLYLMPFF